MYRDHTNTTNTTLTVTGTGPGIGEAIDDHQANMDMRTFALHRISHDNTHVRTTVYLGVAGVGNVLNMKYKYIKTRWGVGMFRVIKK